MVFGINIFPSDVYYLEKMPSEINFISVGVVFFLSLIITSLASYFPAKNISKMKAGFLWQKGNIQRYRINVWQTTYQDGRFCPDTKIIHSYFVFYYPDEQMIVDKTEEPVDKNKDLIGRIRR